MGRETHPNHIKEEGWGSEPDKKERGVSEPDKGGGMGFLNRQNKRRTEQRHCERSVAICKIDEL